MKIFLAVSSMLIAAFTLVEWHLLNCDQEARRQIYWDGYFYGCMGTYTALAPAYTLDHRDDAKRSCARSADDYSRQMDLGD